MKLELNEIILLKYLTKYNIKLIKDLISSEINFESMLNTLFKNGYINSKLYNDSIEQTKISLDKLHFYSIETITIFDEDYPISLKNIADAPLVIYYKGIIRSDKLTAVVGSRKISNHAEKITNQVVDWLYELNHGIVSGLALGIDSIAHKRAVKNNQYTLAILPNSLDTVYPPSNYKLANEILNAGGCIMSEMIFGINRGKQSFVQRNRLQAAFSESIIPIEMGVSSGTMHTIDFAKRYKKKIVILKPTPLLSSLESFAGIIHLINNPNKFQYVFTDKDSFQNIIDSDNNDKQLALGL